LAVSGAGRGVFRVIGEDHLEAGGGQIPGGVQVAQPVLIYVGGLLVGM
jgi:hypothetical protein